MEWTILPEPDIPSELLGWVGHPLFARLLVQRGITTVEAARAFLQPIDYEPASPYELPDMLAAVARLKTAIEAKTSICVWGDFDVDGQTSTALLVSILRALGAEVDYYIPNRLTEGHGIRTERLVRILKEGFELILTCDTGIEAHEAVDAVHAAGAAIIVTDHHDLGETLPPAEAVINPKRLPEDHPLRELPGVGVAYKLAEALSKACGQPELSETTLDLVALGIVADVATQTADTRYLLQRGLEVLRSTERLGLTTLIKMTNLKQPQLTDEHIGFWLGPRLNALGRLGDANQAVELLTTIDQGRARILAAQLDALNERRKLLVDRTVVQALSQIADTPSLAEYSAVVLAAAEWHPGVIGIAASRLVDQFARPAILLTHRDGLVRGSARSVPGCDIHQGIKTQAHLLESFGGHPMAAGLSLKADHIADFRRGLSDALYECVAQIEPRLTVDAVVTLADLNLELLDILEKIAPFGPGNPRVKLAVTGLTLQNATVFGANQAHRRITVVDAGGQTADIIWWSGAAERLPQGTFDLAVTVSRDTYRQREAVQLTWAGMREWVVETVPIQRQLIDLRQKANALQEIDSPAALFWATDPLPGVKRFKPSGTTGTQTKKLVIWQSPPGQDVLQQLLALTQPEFIYIVAQPSKFDTLPAFMNQLMGLIKYSLTHYEGRLEIEALATALGHRSATVRLGLAWLVSQGKLRVDQLAERGDPLQSDAIVIVRPDNQPPESTSNDLKSSLLDLLRETAAYREFVRQANLAALGLAG